MLEKIKEFLATKIGKIVLGCIIIIFVMIIIGAGCYIRGCDAGRKQLIIKNGVIT